MIDRPMGIVVLEKGNNGCVDVACICLGRLLCIVVDCDYVKRLRFYVELCLSCSVCVFYVEFVVIHCGFAKMVSWFKMFLHELL